MLLYNSMKHKSEETASGFLAYPPKKGEKQMKRILAALLMLAILLTGLTVTASAASPWKKDGDYWTYTKSNGKLAEDEWIQDGGTWYYFSGTYMVADSVMQINEKWYAFDKSGAMVVNGWYEKKETWEDETWSNWVRAGANGELLKGWQQIGGKWYYFFGTQKLDKDWWAPVMATGMPLAMDEETGEYFSMFDNGKFYGFRPSGEMIVGWGQLGTSADSAWVYANADGSCDVKCWKKIGGKWYYFDDTGWMYRNGPRQTFDKNDKNIYLFNKSGELVENGWYQPTYKDENGQTIKGSWYYGGKDGVIVKGWAKDNGKWYYLDAEYGYMYSDCMVTMSDNKTYAFDKSGAMVIGWYKAEDGTWYCFDENGAMIEEEWVKTGGKWYYLKEGGAMAQDETLTIGKKDYTFGKDGAWVEK